VKTIGMFTSAIGAAAAALAVVVGIRSIPDIKRYLKMRAM
jgi:hypothetical protein